MKNIKFSHIKSNIENEKIRDLFNYLIVNAFSSRFGNNQRINYYSRNQNYDDDEDEEYESDKKNSNFAIFKKETLNKAYEILNEIGKNINKLEELQKSKKNLTISEMELSNKTSKFNQNLEEKTFLNSLTPSSKVIKGVF